MTSRSRRRSANFQLIGQFSINAAWDGSPTTLNPSDNVNLPQATTGSMVFAYFNLSEQNNPGTLALTSGGSAPNILPVPALANQPSILIKNWKGSNLSVTNISPPGTAIPIWIEAVGPGLPGQSCVALTPDGTPVPLATTQCAQGNLLPRWMQVILQANTGDLTIFAIIGGPADTSGNNAQVIAVNAASDTPAPGYTAASTSNYYTLQINWGGSAIYVVNMSAASGSGAQVQLRPL